MPSINDPKPCWRHGWSRSPPVKLSYGSFCYVHISQEASFYAPCDFHISLFSTESSTVTGLCTLGEPLFGSSRDLDMVLQWVADPHIHRAQTTAWHRQCGNTYAYRAFLLCVNTNFKYLVPTNQNSMNYHSNNLLLCMNAHVILCA